MKKYLNLDQSTNTHFILEGEEKEVIAKDDFQYLQELHNDIYFNLIYGYQLYYNLFNNENMIVFFNEKSLIHIVFDIRTNKIIFIDCNFDDDNIDCDSILIEELRKANFSHDDIVEFLDCREY